MSQDRTYQHQYAQVSEVVDQATQQQVALQTDLSREPVQLQAQLTDPLCFRQTLSALYDVVSADYRYVPKDRTAYLAFKQMRQQSAHLPRFKAQQAYFDWLRHNDPLRYCILDPIISVQPDRLLFEVFSLDEGCYAKLDMDYQLAQPQGEVTYGTTHVDFSQSLFEGLQKMRSYRDSAIQIGRSAVSVTTGQDEVLQKTIRVADSWIRGFLQVQSAAQLTATRFSLKAIDLYNVLRHLRLNADQKGKKRGLRFELIPNQPVRIVLEPWELVIESQAAPYQGPQAQVIRLWGRRRLALLKDLLSLCDDIDVHLLGNGLPSFWVLRHPNLTFTLGLTGFTQSNWSQALNFDALLPRAGQVEKSADYHAIVDALRQQPASISTLQSQLGQSQTALRRLLQQGSQQGDVMYDMAHQCYRYRPLLAQTSDMTALQYRNQTDSQAHALLKHAKTLQDLSVKFVYGQGYQVQGTFVVKEDKRDYLTQLLVNEEDSVAKAECSCHHFQQHQLTQGPCCHLIALRMAFNRYQLEQRSEAQRAAMQSDHCVLSKRSGNVEHVYQIFFEQKRIQTIWGPQHQSKRQQRLVFHSVDDARKAYLAQIQQLQAKGYINHQAD